MYANSCVYVDSGYALSVYPPLIPQHTYHLCTQVHLCLAGCESGARWAAQQNSLLRYTGGGGTNALGPADQLGCRWGGGQVDLGGKDEQDNEVKNFPYSIDMPIHHFPLNNMSNPELYIIYFKRHSNLLKSKKGFTAHRAASVATSYPKASWS